MKSKTDYRRNSFIGAAFGSTLLLTAACSPSEKLPPTATVAAAAAQPTTVQVSADLQDDYDYFPGYETYYSRNRREYVYRDNNAWVRRPMPRGVSADILMAAPSVRLDFHDSPERHHDNVLRSYPRDWKRPDVKVDEKKDGDKRQ